MFSEGYEDIWMESKWTGLIGTYRRKKTKHNIHSFTGKV